jgi:hypothetical protein
VEAFAAVMFTTATGPIRLMADVNVNEPFVLIIGKLSIIVAFGVAVLFNINLIMRGHTGSIILVYVENPA